MGNSESEPVEEQDQVDDFMEVEQVRPKRMSVERIYPREVTNLHIPLRSADGRYHCECGSTVKGSIHAHLQTLKHYNFVVRAHHLSQVVHAPSAPPAPVSVPSKTTTYPRHILEMIVQHDTECPICFEGLTVDTIHVTSCGHSVCKTCRHRLDTCPLCRTHLSA